MADTSVMALRDRLRALERARAQLPPHSAQGMHEELDARIRDVRRQLARATRQDDR